MFAVLSLTSQLKCFNIFQEASRIRDDAGRTKARAEDLLDSAQVLSEEVEDSEDQVGNLQIQANFESEQADKVHTSVLVTFANTVQPVLSRRSRE